MVWSAFTRRRNPVRTDVLRGVVCLPLAVYLYAAEDGVLEKLWIPALLMSVRVALAVGIASRGSLPGSLIALGYAGALLGAAVARFDGRHFESLHDAFGIGLAGCMISLVASKLGRGLDEAHHEMKHRMHIEVELRQAQRLESVGRLAAGVAHEINTPIQFASDSLQFLRNGLTELFDVVDKLEVVQRSVRDGIPSQDAAAMAADASDTADVPYLAENVPKALDRALDGLGRVATIVRSMKEFAHPGSKEMAVADLNRAIESTLTMMTNEYKYVAVLETDYGEIPPIRCHIGELNQVVLSIVINAAHAIADVVHGTATMGRIRVRTYREADDVVITISDTGGGIPEDVRGHVFDPFFTTKGVGRGTGQGLAIAHSVVVGKHRGQLGFETELGKGTTFVIRLPIVAPVIGLVSATSDPMHRGLPPAA
jgi:signal transduction histidine kinase